MKLQKKRYEMNTQGEVTKMTREKGEKNMSGSELDEPTLCEVLLWLTERK